MSRIIKFRIWDTYKKEWLEYFEIDVIHDFQYLVDNGDIVFQEFSGIKDSLGREIYEGDIIKYGDNAAIAVVIFDSAMFYRDFTQSKNQKQVDEIKWGVQEMFNPLGFGREEPTEVIGNIHQNLDLLK